MSLLEKLRARAPLRLDHFIEACLFDPEHGYYTTREVFGQKGDFITAPEISQIFGEMIGQWVLNQWQKIGAPEGFALVEIGAGRGVLMQDVLRALRSVPQCKPEVVIIEKSPRLRALQSERLQTEITFCDGVDGLPALPCILFSNEFFDALPIRQFRFEDGGWLEAFVAQDCRKIWQATPRPPQALAGHMQSGAVIEICEAGIEIARKLGDHIFANGGAMLHVDYGEWEGAGDTLQAVRGHAYSNPFDHLGEADITAQVRFKDIAEAAQLQTQFMTQGEFLNAMGGQKRLEALGLQNPDKRENLEIGYQRLTDATQMGKLFKVIICES